MRVPVTFRARQEVVDALDRAVRDGLADSRAAAVEAAVGEWVARHDEQALVESYRRAYARPDPDHEALLDGFLAASAETIETVVEDEARDAPG